VFRLKKQHERQKKKSTGMNLVWNRLGNLATGWRPTKWDHVRPVGKEKLPKRREGRVLTCLAKMTTQLPGALLESPGEQIDGTGSHGILGGRVLLVQGLAASHRS